MKKIAIFGGSFNPPGVHHLKMVEELLKYFSKVIIVPCGNRPDKKTTNDIEPVHRAAMLDMTFRGMANVEIDFFDLENEVFTRTHLLQERYCRQGEIWHVIGSEFINGGCKGDSFIQKEWSCGEIVWGELNFFIFKRGEIFLQKDLPPHSEIIEFNHDYSSTDIRNRAFNRQSIHNLVVPRAEDYIERYDLYRGHMPGHTTLFKNENPAFILEVDKGNTNAVECGKKIEKYQGDNPNLVVAIGGDGMLIRTAKKYWQKRLPVFGINAGHKGYYLNEVNLDNGLDFLKKLIVHRLPLLDVEVELMNGKTIKQLAFNDAWVKILSGQSAWMMIVLNKQDVISKIVGDGILVSTAAGSTGYAKNIAGYSLPPFSREMMLTGMFISEPENWKQVMISPNSFLEIIALLPGKRPIHGFVDGVDIGKIGSMKVRQSRVAEVELAFLPDMDIVKKHTLLQMPYLKKVI